MTYDCRCFIRTTRSFFLFNSIPHTPNPVLHTMYSILHTLYSIGCTSYPDSILYTPYSILHIMYSIPCTSYSDSIPHTPYHVLHIMYIIPWLHTLYSIPYTSYLLPYTPYSKNLINSCCSYLRMVDLIFSTILSFEHVRSLTQKHHRQCDQIWRFFGFWATF